MNDSLGALIAIAILYLVFRFALGGRNAGPSSTQPIRARSRPVPQELVASVQAMFPQVPEANIRYDLARSGSAEATCDRILAEGSLPAPPAGLFPPQQTERPLQNQASTATIARAGAAGPTGTSFGAKATSSRPQQDLISRFGLQSRLAEEEGDMSIDSNSSLTSAPSSDKGKGKARALDEDSIGDLSNVSARSALSNASSTATTRSAGWSDSRQERESALKTRKELLILEARRKLIQKQQQKSAQGTDAREQAGES